jgi:ArsR family transcriptional regulator
MAIIQSTSVHTAAKLFRGLSDPTRLSILVELMNGEQRVTDIVAKIGGSQSNISAHLSCLKECELITDRPGERRQVFYSISNPELFDLLRSAERVLEVSGTSIELCHNPLYQIGDKDE